MRSKPQMLRTGALLETYGKPLRIIGRRRREQGAERVVARNDKARQVGQELATEVEDDEEEVERDEADNSIRLRDRRLLLEVVEGGVLGQLQRRRCVSQDVADATGAVKANVATWGRRGRH